jgi:predicted GIY-YIG superfamily endonuclease
MDINPETVLQKDLDEVQGGQRQGGGEVQGAGGGIGGGEGGGSGGVEEGGIGGVGSGGGVPEAVDIINNTLVCYCIRNETKNRTYVGATNHFTRRIRQHNREIVGGAKATAGHKWHNIILVHGFNTRHDLLSFEWHFKHVVTVNKNGVKRRVEALKKLLSIDRWKMLKMVVSDELKELFL